MNLRGDGGNALLKPSEYSLCSSSLCATYGICCMHVHNNKETVRVQSHLKRGTSETILEILEKEKPKYLITLPEMKYINQFVNATGEEPFPFFILVKDGMKYAVPQIRSSRDTEICSEKFC
jgi:hypothetical protein